MACCGPLQAGARGAPPTPFARLASTHLNPQIKQAAKRALKRDPNSVEVSLIGAVAGGFTGAPRRLQLLKAAATAPLRTCSSRPCPPRPRRPRSLALAPSRLTRPPPPGPRHPPRHPGIVTTPLDVLKTRLMTQGASGRYKNLVDATLTIARTEGWRAFLAGWQPRLIWISLGGFVFFPALEAAKKAFGPDGGLMTPPDTQFVIEELELKDMKKAKKRAEKDK